MCSDFLLFKDFKNGGLKEFNHDGDNIIPSLNGFFWYSPNDAKYGILNVYELQSIIK